MQLGIFDNGFGKNRTDKPCFAETGHSGVFFCQMLSIIINKIYKTERGLLKMGEKKITFANFAKMKREGKKGNAYLYRVVEV